MTMLDPLHEPILTPEMVEAVMHDLQDPTHLQTIWRLLGQNNHALLIGILRAAEGHKNNTKDSGDAFVRGAQFILSAVHAAGEMETLEALFGTTSTSTDVLNMCQQGTLWDEVPYPTAEAA